ncbi:MAG: orotidine-5'-phosphate decarboxylase [Zetaproteobacteria bacterium CG_4_9_14_3_um_filter_49_83]|nr:MAG: orotidine 5'-phosphate decarboxylase [Zetaproteobacteria bacterium CG1_02_49_23]PIQ33972.1 MAG: orotidine-5'-phosphate decarboxylase [Zetaproteobacteria bacterium CG17_big_fil_post_rev_8_21_14_2_50_50_13]PIY56753.1 MAG: orotidine-5'-phosphate decarboxylase [Zetaproteobacteria bacterium CG_4_10_14_0_8_um_filter_49_80]PJA35973.1 MAG: orotidine-5'-phosphate decarboxylase [Zetaproteobacteria bacterium CG_4_9_14_3_um_filter_49_83]
MIALDVENAQLALDVSQNLSSHVGWFKVGLRLFVAEGPVLIKKLSEQNKIFLDLKFHDIPNTVAQAVQSAGGLGVQMLNVHAAGGPDMLKRAADAASMFPDMKLIAVTVLTSEALPEDLAEELVVTRALLSKECGLDGVVCSVQEAKAVKHACGHDFITVTPGIRWGEQDVQDQKRIADPTTAITSGADFLVVGRPILGAKNPLDAVNEALEMMHKAASIK